MCWSQQHHGSGCGVNEGKNVDEGRGCGRGEGVGTRGGKGCKRE